MNRYWTAASVAAVTFAGASIAYRGAEGVQIPTTGFQLDPDIAKWLFSALSAGVTLAIAMLAKYRPKLAAFLKMLWDKIRPSPKSPQQRDDAPRSLIEDVADQGIHLADLGDHIGVDKSVELYQHLLEKRTRQHQVDDDPETHS